MSTESQFLLKMLSSLYLNDKTADAKFMFEIDNGVEEVPVHKNILAAASPVFEAMFFGQLKEGDAVKITDSNLGAFKEFLQLVYLDDPKLTMRNMEEVARLADKYDMNKRLNMYLASQIEKISMDNIFWGYQLAIVTEHDDLKQRCEKFIFEFPNEAFKSEQFLRCDQKTLKQMLLLDGLRCEETDVFAASIEWAKFNCKQNGIDEKNMANLVTQLGGCFDLIRFCAMSRDEFDECTSPFREVFSQTFSICLKSISVLNLTRSASPLEWDDDNQMRCFESEYCCRFPFEKHFIQSTESLCFSSNKPLILGKILYYEVLHGDGNEFIADFNVKIYEIGAQSDKLIVTTKIANKSESYVHLPQPIAINPRKKYKIRYDTELNITNCYYQKRPSVPEYKLKDGTEVKFHRNPLSNELGLVDGLYFNQF